MFHIHMEPKPVRLAVGMMSGTSVDGIDAALVELTDGDRQEAADAGQAGAARAAAENGITRTEPAGAARTRAEKISSGYYAARPRVRLLAFENRPFPEEIRRQIFDLFRPETSSADRIGYMNFLLGELYAEAALSVIRKAGRRPEEVDVIGSHGQTIWHEPVPCGKDGFPVRYTVQIGEGAVIAERTGILTVTDFRAADMAAGGQGAPLVPFSEYLLYRRENETVLLQNIGGIGNMTVLPAACRPDKVYAFDTGPGNMIIDAVISALTGGRQTFDAGGGIAAQGTVNTDLLALLEQDEYYRLPLPKSTGREHFGLQYTQKILDWYARSCGNRTSVPEDGLADLLATVTDLTAWSIADAYRRYVLPKYRASELIVGGGGSYNRTLLSFLSRRLAPYGVAVRTQEDLGENSDAKEAVAFALMADYCVRGRVNSLPGVTGAGKAAILGKISLPA